MLNTKKLIASIFAMSSSIVFANSMKPEHEVNACDHKNWEVGVTALYLQPSLSGNGLGYSSFSNYAGADNSGVIVTSNGPNHINNVTPEWKFAYRVEGTHHFRSNKDVNLNWSHLHETVDGKLPAGSLFSGSVDGFYADRLELGTKWDAINLEFGKYIAIDNRKLLRLHAGVEYANIKTTFTNHPKIFANSDPYFTSNDEHSYSGFGPRLGTDFQYQVANGLGVYAKAAGSILVGSAKQVVSGYRDYTNTLYGLIPFGIPNYTYSNHNVVVPEFEAKLGVTYERKFAHGNLGIDLGYLWMNYLNAIPSYTGIGIVGSSIGIPTMTNFNLNGVYLGFNWAGNI